MSETQSLWQQTSELALSMLRERLARPGIDEILPKQGERINIPTMNDESEKYIEHPSVVRDWLSGLGLNG